MKANGNKDVSTEIIEKAGHQFVPRSSFFSRPRKTCCSATKTIPDSIMPFLCSIYLDNPTKFNAILRRELLRDARV
jgi:hypothetical protein